MYELYSLYSLFIEKSDFDFDPELEESDELDDLDDLDELADRDGFLVWVGSNVDKIWIQPSQKNRNTDYFTWPLNLRVNTARVLATVGCPIDSLFSLVVSEACSDFCRWIGLKQTLQNLVLHGGYSYALHMVTYELGEAIWLNDEKSMTTLINIAIGLIHLGADMHFTWNSRTPLVDLTSYGETEDTDLQVHF
jgi:hypothetical protein